MLPVLVRRFGGGDLSIMLEKAKQADKTYVVARLQRQQMAFWRREGLTTDQVFKFYKLDDGATNLLENPGLKIWMKYADDFINPEDPTLVVKKLQKTYSDEALAQILLKGKTVASTEKLATDLQLRLWLKDLVPPEKVFRLLSLNKADDVFGSPQFQTWIRYSKDYAKQNPHAHKATLIDTLLDNFDTAAIVSLIKTRPNTISGKHYASQVERDLVKRWVAEGKSLDFVVAKLRTSTTNQKFVAGLYNKYKKLQTPA
ncbi:hypothetical protein DVH05_016339 [Phytophthora capsici]|nr:hypothetical protein DVH05_016339 [Phytophthora capsici]